MTLAKLQQQLLRDLKRSPKKAAVLGLACLAAVYFWAPLVSGWINPAKPGVAGTTLESQPVAQAAPLAPTIVEGANASVSPASKGPQYAWQQLAAAIDSDPRMRTEEIDLSESEAFGRKRPEPAELAEDELKTDNETPKVADRSPEQLGLSLTGAMIGPRRRVAIINGRSCVEGSLITVGEDVTFVVTEVRPREAVLVRNDKQYVLPLVRRGGDGKKDGLVLMRAAE